MAEEGSSDPGFTIIDKRGRREEAAAPAAEPRGESPTADAGKAPGRAGEPRRAPPPPGSLPPPDFTAFILMLYGEALMHLGEAPNPFTRQVHQDLDQAKDTIDLLDLLRVKTEGNRTPEESRVLDEVLYALRMHYLQAAKTQ